jgi:hypothetical protein
MEIMNSRKIIKNGIVSAYNTFTRNNKLIKHTQNQFKYIQISGENISPKWQL